VAVLTEYSVSVFLQYAKNMAEVQAHAGELFPGFQVSVAFADLSGWKPKILIPQNVVATYPANILHIEFFLQSVLT
jgi:hypothetical protein